MPDNTFNLNQIKYLNALNLIPELGAVSLTKILEFFTTIEEAWTASEGKLTETGIPPLQIKKFIARRNSINPEYEIAKLRQLNIKAITIYDSDYPSLLKEIHTPPPIIYIRGTILPQDKTSLAIVGTRKISNYGREIVPNITRNLSLAGFTIISGLAKGTDTLAHQAALKAGGRTIAVLGTSVDRQHIYPNINKYLAEQITKQGALISEFPLGTKPLPHNFPLRNRIISGLSLGTLVTEAPRRSGALITAKYALEQNRDVFAIPGSIRSFNSCGPHMLIQMGAKLVTQASDIIEEFNITHQKQSTLINY